MGYLYNEFGVQVYTFEEYVISLSKEISTLSRQIKDMEKKLDKKNFKNFSKLDWSRGYLAALEKMRDDLNRKNWKIGKEIEYPDTPKGKIFKFIDENVIPELNEEDLDTILSLKEELNEIYDY